MLETDNIRFYHAREAEDLYEVLADTHFSVKGI